MAKLTSSARNKLKSSTFGLPGSRRFPMPDRSHAANAKSRATQGVNAGTLSPSSAATIRAKANRILSNGNPNVTQDLNAATLGARAVPRAGAADNRNPATPYQEDINNWKSRPVTTRGKWMNDSQGKGAATDSGKGANFKSQAKFGGTQAASASKKAVAKVSGGTTPNTGKNYKGQEKFGGTGTGNGGNGKRYSNGSGSFDSLKGMIRDH